LHEFSFIDTTKAEGSSDDKEDSKPEVKVLEGLPGVEGLENFGEGFGSHDTFGGAGAEQVGSDENAGEVLPLPAVQDSKLIGMVIGLFVEFLLFFRQV
jgi:hypothetical protein